MWHLKSHKEFIDNIANLEKLSKVLYKNKLELILLSEQSGERYAKLLTKLDLFMHELRNISIIIQTTTQDKQDMHREFILGKCDTLVKQGGNIIVSIDIFTGFSFAELDLPGFSPTITTMAMKLNKIVFKPILPVNESEDSE